MRFLGSLDTRDAARRFARVLAAANIEHNIESDQIHSFQIWVYDDDRLEEAQSLLARFRSDPNRAEFSVPIEPVVLPPQARNGRGRWQSVDMRTAMHRQRSRKIGQVTLALIIASVAISIFSITHREDLIHWFYFSDIQVSGEQAYYLPGFDDIKNGQVWRLFTPMFLHFGVIHLLFDMLWLKDLGSVVEARKSPLYLLVFVLVVSALSNSAQFMVSGDPFFGGMSGVVYALLGFIWMKSRFDPASGFFIDKQTVVMMVVWYFLCLVGIIGNIANTVHTVGLVVGIVWGLVDSNPFEIYRQWQRRKEFRGKFN
jgi:GlpG protein